MQSTQRLIQLSKHSINLDTIKCIDWVTPIGATVYVGVADKYDEDYHEGGYDCIALDKDDQNYEKDKFLLKQGSMLNAHLVHLKTMSIDLRFIHDIAWDRPFGIVIYVGRRTNDRHYRYNTVALSKEHRHYTSNRGLLREAIEKWIRE